MAMNDSDLGGEVGPGGYLGLLQGVRPSGYSTPFHSMQGVAMLGAGGSDRSFDDIPLSQNITSPALRAALQHSSVNVLDCAGSGNSHSMEQGDVNECDKDGTMIPLPVYSARIQDVLTKGNVLVDFDLFIEETAYHVVRNGDMKGKSEYQDFGRRLLVAYPCLEFPGVTTAWVRLVLVTFTALGISRWILFLILCYII